MTFDWNTVTSDDKWGKLTIKHVNTGFEMWCSLSEAKGIIRNVMDFQKEIVDRLNGFEIYLKDKAKSDETNK